MNLHLQDLDKFEEYLSDSYYFIYFAIEELEKIIFQLNSQFFRILRVIMILFQFLLLVLLGYGNSCQEQEDYMNSTNPGGMRIGMIHSSLLKLLLVT